MPKRRPGALELFLTHSRRHPGTLRYHELQGFLFAVASCPDLVKPGEWLPIVFGGGSAGYADLEEAQRILDELMTLYNSINAGVREGNATLPRDCRFRGDILANLDEDAPIAQWSRGFLTGHQWLEESWEHVPSELDDDFAAMLMTLSFFSSRRLAEAFHAESGSRSLERLAGAVRRVFRTALHDYAQLGLAIDQALREQQQTYQRDRPKVGRNDPCPCGSGRKFKKCCGVSVH